MKRKLKNRILESAGKSADVLESLGQKMIEEAEEIKKTVKKASS